MKKEKIKKMKKRLIELAKNGSWDFRDERDFYIINGQIEAMKLIEYLNKKLKIKR